MKLTNTTAFSDLFLRRMTVWCAQQLGVPIRKPRMNYKTLSHWSKLRNGPVIYLRKIHFGMRVRFWRGTAWESGRIIIRIGSPEGYPVTHKYPGRVYAPEYTINDWIEALVRVTLHELAHLAQWNEGKKRNREGRVDAIALEKLELFRAQRETLYWQWREEKPGRPSKPQISRREKNEIRARELLALWERKGTMAKKKIAKYRRSVNRYDRIAANKSP